jgi:hypothetical protein
MTVEPRPLPPGAPTRVRFIRLLLPGVRWGVILLVILGFFVLWPVTFAGLFGLLTVGQRLLGPASGRMPGVLIGLCAIVSFGATLAWISFVDGVSRRRLLQRRPRRGARLDDLARRPDAPRRAPHRLVERVFRHERRRRAFERNLTEVLRCIPPGWVIVINSIWKSNPPAPVPTALVFEPVDLYEPDDALCQLAQSGYPEPEHDATVSESDPALFRRIRRGLRAAARRMHTRSRPIPSWLVLGLPIIWSYQLIRRPDWFNLIVLVGMLGPLLVRVSRGLLAGRDWWLVPGGIAWRKHRLWRRSVEVGLVTRRDAPLVVDLTGTAYTVAGGRLCRFRFPHAGTEWFVWGMAAFLVAWVCTARTPTREEVLAFMGPDAEWVE